MKFLRVITIFAFILFAFESVSQISSIDLSIAGNTETGSNNLITVNDCSDLAGQLITVDVDFFVNSTYYESSGSNRVDIKLYNKKNLSWIIMGTEENFLDNGSSSTCVTEADMSAVVSYQHRIEAVDGEFKLVFTLKTDDQSGECHPADDEWTQEYFFEVEHSDFTAPNRTVANSNYIQGSPDYYEVCEDRIAVITDLVSSSSGCSRTQDIYLVKVGSDFASNPDTVWSTEIGDWKKADPSWGLPNNYHSANSVAMGSTVEETELEPNSYYKVWYIIMDYEWPATYSFNLKTIDWSDITPSSTSFETCDGVDATLGVTGPGTFTWWKGSTQVGSGSSYTVTAPANSDTYTVRRTDEICYNPLDIDLTVHPNPEVTVNSGIKFCEDDMPYDFNGEVSVSINETVDPANFNWPPVCGFISSSPGFFDPIAESCTLSSYPTTHSYSTLIQYVSNEGCESEYESIDFSWNDSPEFNELLTDPSCFGLSDGEIEIDPEGDEQIDLYWNGSTSAETWTNGTYTFDQLSSGNYNVELIDEEGCTSDQIFTLSDPTAITLSGVSSINHPLCTSATTPYVQGGTGTTIWGGATFSWSGGVGPFALELNGSTAVSPITASPYTLSNMTAGSGIQWNVIDDNGCSAATNGTYDLTPQTNMSPTITISDALCEGVNSGSIQLDITNTVNSSNITSSCSYVWSNGNSTTSSNSSLSAGSSHNITVTSGDGCLLYIEDLDIDTQNDPFTVTPSVVQPACDGVTGGEVDASNNTANSPSYAWSTGASTASITGLVDGTYIVTVTETQTGAYNGCHEIDQVTLTAATTDSWHQKTGDQNSSTDQIVAVETDAQDNIYVLGSYTGQTTVGSTTINTGSSVHKGFFIAKYDQCGKLLWIKNSEIDLSTGGGYFDIVPSDLVLENNNIYAVSSTNGAQFDAFKLNGLSYSLPQPSSWVSTKLNSSNGSTSCISFVSTSLQQSDVIHDIEAFDTGNGTKLYAAGKDNGTGAATVFEIDPCTGTTSTFLQDQETTPNSEFTDIEFNTVSGTEYLYAAGGATGAASFDGSSLSLSGSEDGILVRCELNTSGGITYNSTLNDQSNTGTNTAARINSLEIDNNDDIILAGTYDGSISWGSLATGMENAFVARVSDGTALSVDWAHDIDELSGQTSSAQGTDVSIDADGDVLLLGAFEGSDIQISTTGYSESSTGTSNKSTAFIASFVNNSSGNIEWVETAKSSSDVTPTSIVSGDVNTYVGGGFYDDLDFSTTGEPDLTHANQTSESGFLLRIGTQYTNGTAGQFYKNSNTKYEINDLVSVFPNPTDGTVNLTWNAFDGDCEFTLMDNHGRVVDIFSESGNIGMTELNFTTLAQGTYVLEMRLDDKTVRHQIVKY